MPNTSKLLTAFATLVTATGGPGCSEDDTNVPAPDAAAPVQPEVLALPGQAFYPESIHAANDGTLYAGSLATGEVVAFADGDETPHTLISPGQHGITGVTGVHVNGETLWLCSVDTTFQRATEVRSFTRTGTPLAVYPLPATAFCNDLAIDSNGTVYATDSFSGTVQRLSPGATQFEQFVQDARFVPDSQGAFGLDGIVIAGAKLLVNKLDTGELFSISITTKAIEPIALSAPLAGPDGMRLLDDDSLLVIEGTANRLSRVDIAGSLGSVSTIATDLDMPTAVTVSRGFAWVSEGQLGRLFTGQSPNLPFSVRRVAL
jgi:sugar lactone lactonase YvrE